MSDSCIGGGAARSSANLWDRPQRPGGAPRARAPRYFYVPTSDETRTVQQMLRIAFADRRVWEAQRRVPGQVRPLNATARQTLLLAWCMQRDFTRPKAVDLLAVHPSAIHHSVKELALRDLVDLDDPGDDRRRLDPVITAEGEAAAKELVQEAVPALAELKGWPKSFYATLAGGR